MHHFTLCEKKTSLYICSLLVSLFYQVFHEKEEEGKQEERENKIKTDRETVKMK